VAPVVAVISVAHPLKKTAAENMKFLPNIPIYFVSPFQIGLSTYVRSLQTNPVVAASAQSCPVAELRCTAVLGTSLSPASEFFSGHRKFCHDRKYPLVTHNGSTEKNWAHGPPVTAECSQRLLSYFSTCCLIASVASVISLSSSPPPAAEVLSVLSEASSSLLPRIPQSFGSW
jgi:hypothetical protein